MTPHGTYARYKGGCRCEQCASYQRDRVRRNRAARLAAGRLSHGTQSAWDAGCRCEACREAKRLARQRLAGIA